MRKRVILLSSLFLLVSVSPASLAAGQQVARIYDGDTLTMATGEKVRLLQIDTPELSPSECYGAEARKALVGLIGKSPVTLETDPVSDDQDQYDRLLRYVKVGKINVNLKMVELGAATPYFYNGEKGKYSAQLLKAAQKAKAKKIGLWKKCPGTQLDPSKPATTDSVTEAPIEIAPQTTKSDCDPNYQGCIPPYPPDLDCSDIKKMGLAPIRVIGMDVHKFDGDGDGVGCDK
jgi:micrococcal nuclease